MIQSLCPIMSNLLIQRDFHTFGHTNGRTNHTNFPFESMRMAPTTGRVPTTGRRVKKASRLERRPHLKLTSGVAMQEAKRGEIMRN